MANEVTALVRQFSTDLAIALQAEREVEKYKELEDLLEFHKKAMLFIAYAKAKHESPEAFRFGFSLAAYARRRAGPMIPASGVGTGKTPTLGALGIDHHESSRWQALATIPKKRFDRWIEETTRPTFSKLYQLTKVQEIRGGPSIKVFEADITKPETWEGIEADSIDFIITDPPYSLEYLTLYSSLSFFATKVLKSGGSLLTLCGASLLPQVIHNLQKHLEYHWELNYATPGGQSAQLWELKVNSFRKPLLWYCKGKYDGKWVGDDCKSTTNEKNDHKWGQGYSGFNDILSRFVIEGQLICDPFLGGGTTALAAANNKCNFVGFDNDPKCVSRSIERLKSAKLCMK